MLCAMGKAIIHLPSPKTATCCEIPPSPRKASSNAGIDAKLLPDTDTYVTLNLATTAPSNQTQIELLVASPMRRAIHTCQLSFQPAVERGLVIVCLPHAEEVSDAPADTGSPVNVLQAEFGSAVNFDHLEEGWFKHDGEFAIDPKAVKARATKLRQWLKARPEKEIAMVSHGFFNHYLCEEVDDDGQQTTPWYSGPRKKRACSEADREKEVLTSHLQVERS